MTFAKKSSVKSNQYFLKAKGLHSLLANSGESGFQTFSLEIQREELANFAIKNRSSTSNHHNTVAGTTILCGPQ